jgi:acylphosphatase
MIATDAMPDPSARATVNAASCSDMPVRAIRATITGRVQGVGFRWATRRTAAALGLSGWVRNRADGTVEVQAQGDEEAVVDLLRFLHHGPPGAMVTSVVVEATVATPGLDRFEITA